ncbi:MAG: ferritin family protein [Phycisphaerae bacterium]|jgi:rubrerythrin
MDEYREKVRQLSMEKALAVAAYGESVAAYRYRTLAEKTTSEVHRKVFVEMADEEQAHHIEVRTCARRYLPSTDFVLTKADKDLIIVGSRHVEATDPESFAEVIKVIIESEWLTGRFYATLHELTTVEELKPMLRAMADECQVHAKRLEDIPSLE